MSIYLDNASTTPVCPEAAIEAVDAMTKNYGNPSSGHRLGRDAAKQLEKSRVQVAAALGCDPGELTFTSGGTESDNWAILSAARKMRRHGNHIISSPVEHEAVLKSLEALEAEGYRVTLLSPGPSGKILPEAVQGALEPDTVLVTLMMVNNETGALTDIAAISRLIRESGSRALLHTDAVQGFLKLPWSAGELGADLISLSAHKIHGMKGSGALYIRDSLHLPPLIAGGGQESGLRSGTEALPQIAAFGAAAELGYEGLAEAEKSMREIKESIVASLSESIPPLVVIPGEAPHILSIAIPGYKSEVMMNFLEARGIYVSKSSACKKGGRSHVLTALGLRPEIIDGALRLGLSRYTTHGDGLAFCQALTEAFESLFPAL